MFFLNCRSSPSSLQKAPTVIHGYGLYGDTISNLLLAVTAQHQSPHELAPSNVLPNFSVHSMGCLTSQIGQLSGGLSLGLYKTAPDKVEAHALRMCSGWAPSPYPGRTTVHLFDDFSSLERGLLGGTHFLNVCLEPRTRIKIPAHAVTLPTRCQHG
jgi:hypothetical protein